MTGYEPYDPLAQAAAWRIRLAEARRASCEEFEDWLTADPRNACAWRRVQIPWEMLAEHAASSEVIQLRHAALAHANAAVVAPGIRSRRQRVGRILALSAAVVVLAVGCGLLWQNFHFDVYRTRAGERRTETLSDGSEITLDSNSEVRVRYSRHSRELILAGGQALFNVAHDVLRPFSVTAAHHEIVATGTSFNVDMLGPQVLVTLLEGHVVVVSHNDGPASAIPELAPVGLPPAAPARIDLDAGEQLILAPRADPTITRINVDHAVAWEKGRLVFENEPLASVVERIDRYSAHPIYISDDTTASLRISGVFHEGDVEGFVSTVVTYLSVRAEQGRDGSVHLSSPAP